MLTKFNQMTWTLNENHLTVPLIAYSEFEAATSLTCVQWNAE